MYGILRLSLFPMWPFGPFPYLGWKWSVAVTFELG